LAIDTNSQPQRTFFQLVLRHIRNNTVHHLHTRDCNDISGYAILSLQEGKHLNIIQDITEAMRLKFQTLHERDWIYPVELERSYAGIPPWSDSVYRNHSISIDLLQLRSLNRCVALDAQNVSVQ